MTSRQKRYDCLATKQPDGTWKANCDQIEVDIAYRELMEMLIKCNNQLDRQKGAGQAAVNTLRESIKELQEEIEALEEKNRTTASTLSDERMMTNGALKALQAKVVTLQENIKSLKTEVKEKKDNDLRRKTNRAAAQTLGMQRVFELKMKKKRKGGLTTAEETELDRLNGDDSPDVDRRKKKIQFNKKNKTTVESFLSSLSMLHQQRSGQ